MLNEVAFTRGSKGQESHDSLYFIEVKDKSLRKACYDLVIKAYKPVIETLEISKENSPSFTAFIDYPSFSMKVTRNTELYCLMDKDQILACGSLELMKDGLGKIKFLATEVTLQDQGYGTRMLIFLENLARDRGCKGISLGALSENTTLIKWYEKRAYRTVKKSSLNKGSFHISMMKKMW
jgi:ribosomal protein S18 acetylase RimI-like enzyme